MEQLKKLERNVRKYEEEIEGLKEQEKQQIKVCFLSFS